MTAPTGFASAQNVAGDFAQLEFVVSQLAGKMATTALVKIVAVNNHDEVAPVGLVDILPLVHQVDGAGKAVPHGTIHNVPYFRVQGGPNAVIIDPRVGDIGIAVFASHDGSKVKSTKAAALPGSRRRFDWADALYIGGVLNGTPTRYVRFSDAGIELKAELVTINGDVQLNGRMDATGDVVANSISLESHVHSGVQAGSDDTGAPV